MGPFEIALLLFVVFLVLGPKRITSLFQALGRGIRDFKLEFGEKDKDSELPEDEDRDTTLRKK
ncbi:MAG TPA: twin-arginine translocase TatA/TatE family subunit [Rubrobacteraceae bacterium]|nr:twin-arginine translocase TatA/TatE family subunit [Rubrobacteraceae bacterium]